MDPHTQTETKAGDVSPEAEQTSAPDVTEGSASSAEAAPDTRSPADKARDDFIKLYGEETDEEEPTTEEAETEAEAGEPSDPAPEDADDESDVEHKDDSDRLTKEEYAALTPKAQKRLGKLSAERRELKKQVETLTSESATYRESHEALTALQDFTARHNMTTEDVNSSLGYASKFSSGDFRGFLDGIMPFVNIAQEALGERVAPEIQELLDAGDVSPEAAARMTKAERARAIAEAAAERERNARTALETTQSQQGHLQGILQAVKTVEGELRRSDPDYALKETALKEEFRRLLKYGGIPQDSKKAAEIIREIHAGLKATKPTPPPTPKVPSATSGPARQAAPRNTLDVLKMATENMPG